VCSSDLPKTPKPQLMSVVAIINMKIFDHSSTELSRLSR